ncbi:MAG: hypothetical protein MMC33_005359 [Icmadophila ericetorum]|nr:hypothetical protein [Icmadophila ericetorum]
MENDEGYHSSNDISSPTKRRRLGPAGRPCDYSTPEPPCFSPLTTEFPTPGEAAGADTGLGVETTKGSDDGKDKYLDKMTGGVELNGAKAEVIGVAGKELERRALKDYDVGPGKRFAFDWSKVWILKCRCDTFINQKQK